MSVSQKMAGSDDRISKLYSLLEAISLEESDIAAKLASVLAVANMLTDDFFFAMNEEGRIIFSNDANILGYTAAELKDKSIAFILRDGERDVMLERLKHYIETGEKSLPSWDNVPITLLHKEGHNVDVLMNFADMTVINHRVLVGLIRLPEKVLTDQILDAVADRVIKKVGENLEKKGD